MFKRLVYSYIQNNNILMTFILNKRFRHYYTLNAKNFLGFILIKYQSID